MTEASFPPAAEFVAQANASAVLYEQAEADRLAFWGEQARRLAWATPFTEVLDWSQAPFATWFGGGRLNVAYNCVDRHVEAGNGERVAIHWVGEPLDDQRSITYAQLKDEVSRAANALTELGLVAGDRVAIYLPMVPEAIVAMLACARLGVMHSVVFAGYSASALSARIGDAQAKLVITTDGQYRRGKAASLKDAVDEARRRLRERGARSGGAPHRDRRGLDPGTRPVVARRRGRRLPRARARGLRRRASPVLALHLRHHRQAQGHRAQHRRLPLTRPATPTSTSSTSNPSTTCSGAPPTSAGSPATPTSSTDHCPTASPRSSTKAPPPHPTSTATSRSSKNTVSPSITPPPPWSARS